MASVSQLDVVLLVIGVCGLDPATGRQHSFVEIDHEILSRVILSLLLIQERHLSISGKRKCTILINTLEDSLSSKSMFR